MPDLIQRLVTSNAGRQALSSVGLPAPAELRRHEPGAPLLHGPAQQALEGFLRSLGKELRGGSTANLVRVDPGAEDGIESTLRFLASGRSAFVSGQPVRVGPATDEAPAARACWERDVATTELSTPPSLTKLYGRAALTALLPGRGDGLADERVVLPDVPIDRDHVAAYDRVCGFLLRDRLPATYLHVVAFPLAVELMARREFPYPLPGLIHVANRITQHRPLTPADRPTLRVSLGSLAPHPKGTQLDIVGEASVGDEVVWTDVSSYLHRDGGDPDADAPGPSHTLTRSADAAVWRVPAGTGRRYGAVSGDRNPIHLHPLTAKLFGFPRQIAHGMWTKARCLAALDGRVPDAFTVDVAFKAPIVLPARVAFSAEPMHDGWRFAVHGTRDDRPHLAGELTAP